MKMHKVSMVFLIVFFLSAFKYVKNKNYYSLTVKVQELNNETGEVQFALYNEDGTIPDKDFIKYFKMLKSPIVNKASMVTFSNLQKGKYAVNILHDENKNGKIEKGFLLPKEGIGFSNYQSIGITKRPNFDKASFTLKGDTTIFIKVIYM